MGIFTRFKDIVSANVNSMLDKAEDPEKLVRLMIREMEETLVEIKAGCAARMAERAGLDRRVEELSRRAALWETRARLAVDKGRDDLAREALAERKRFARECDALREELAEADRLVAACREDIALLEDKLVAAKEKQRTLIERHNRAGERKKARTVARKAEENEALLRFTRFEERIERMEAEAEMEGPHRGGGKDLESAFRDLEGDDEVEAELARLKNEAANRG